MILSWSFIKSVSLTLGPIFLPKAYSYYKSARAAPVVAGKPVRPLPLKSQRALVLLSAACFGFLVKSVPYLAPENIFVITQSRLQIPQDVLFTRLSHLRAPGGLTESDHMLRNQLVSQASRLLYFQYGPDALANCLWCKSEDPRSYLYYSIPSILTPHLLNMCLIALVTSGLFVGKEAASWRSTATICAVGIAALDLFATGMNDHLQNARATRLEDIQMFYWTFRTCRLIALAALDAVLGWVIWLTATNRAFVTPFSPAERIQTATRVLESVSGNMNASGVIRNTITRDEELRGRSQSYWYQEQRVMTQAMEEREVLDGVRDALDNRIDIRRIEVDAGAYAANVIDLGRQHAE